MNITLATVGTRGDVQPMLALAQTLRERGHAVRIAAPPDFEPWVVSQGFAFSPVGADMKQYLAANPALLAGDAAGSYKAGAIFFASQLPLHVRDIEAACKAADAVVWSGLAIATVVVADKLKLPVLGVMYTSCLVPSSMHPPPSVPRHGLPGWVNRLLWRLNRFMGARMVGAPLNTFRREAGLPAVNFRVDMESRDYVLAVDPQLFPRDPLWGRSIHPGNFIFYDDPRPLEPDLDAWLAAGEPPVFIGFGSMSGDGTARMEQVVHDALVSTGRRCLISAGWAGLGARDLPANWRVVGDVPHGLLFPRVAAVVHHGGSGTMAAALRAAVPQVVLPLILDQFHHAHRLWHAGLAPRPVPMAKITAPQLAAAIDAAIALPPEPRLAVARRLQASDSRSGIADLLEALAARPVTATATST